MLRNVFNLKVNEKGRGKDIGSPLIEHTEAVCRIGEYPKVMLMQITIHGQYSWNSKFIMKSAFFQI